MNNAIALENLKPGETVELILRRHWIVFWYLAFHAFVFLLVMVLLLAFRNAVFSFMPNYIFAPILCIGAMVYLLVLYVYWVNYELDVFILTSLRVISLEQFSFLNRTVSECSLQKVQEVDARTKGLLANLLNFGILTINTAAETSNFVLPLAPDPLNNARHIQNIVDNYRTTLHIEQANGI